MTAHRLQTPAKSMVECRGFCSSRNVVPLADESALTKLGELPIIVSGLFWHCSALSLSEALIVGRVRYRSKPKSLIVDARDLVPASEMSQGGQDGSTETTEILIVDSRAP